MEPELGLVVCAGARARRGRRSRGTRGVPAGGSPDDSPPVSAVSASQIVLDRCLAGRLVPRAEPRCPSSEYGHADSGPTTGAPLEGQPHGRVAVTDRVALGIGVRTEAIRPLVPRPPRTCCTRPPTRTPSWVARTPWLAGSAGAGGARPQQTVLDAAMQPESYLADFCLLPCVILRPSPAASG